jgi:DNA-binding MarR family transcriptional regulator
MLVESSLKPTDDHDTLYMSERDMGVLRVLEEEELANFSFEGLKRRIGTHPETLSRVLSRLEEQNIVERAEDGYRVTTAGREQLQIHPIEASAERMTLLKTMLPPNGNLQTVFANLRGRWFGSLRWLGNSQGGSEVVMKWVTEDGRVQLDARFTPGELTIEARLLHGRELASAVRSAHQLLAHISRAYSPPAGRALLFEASRTHFTPN